MIALIKDLAGFVRFVLRRWSEDRCPQMAGSLTYTTLLALAPMFAIAVAVLSTGPFHGVVQGFNDFLKLNLVPATASRVISVYMAQIAANALRLTWVGVIAVLVIAIWLMLSMDRSLNAIWRVRRARPYWISAIGYTTLLMLGPMLIVASVSFTTYVMSLSEHVTGLGARVHTFLLRLFPVLMSTFAFFLIYRIIPHRHVPWRHALLGSAVAGVLFESAKQLFSMYVSVTPAYNIVYGALAAIPIFLIWIYLSWLVVLFGAELTAAAAWWQGGRWKTAPRPGIRFREAVIIVRAMIDAPHGRMKFDALRDLSLMSPEELDETLAGMVEAGVLKTRGRSGYELGPGTREVLAAPRPAEREEEPVRKAARGKARNARSSR